MADLRKKNSTVSAYLLFLVVLLVVAAAAIMLWPVYQDYRKKQTELNDLNARLNDRREESARLNTEVADLKRSRRRWRRSPARSSAWSETTKV